MHPPDERSRHLTDRRRFVALNIIGGVAVLGSYIVGGLTQPDLVGGIWGGVPESVHPIYTANMFLAAAGYFMFSHYIYFQLRAPEVQVFGRPAQRVWLWLYTGILLPSAVWMPLTLWMVASPSMGLWVAICAVLAVVALSSLALVAALLAARPAGTARGRIVAAAGAVFFSIQTALLDAVVWTICFPLP